MTAISRRQFLASTVILGATALANSPHSAAFAADPDVIRLRVESRVIEVNGRSTKVFALRQPDGTSGILTTAGDRFRVRLENRSGEPTLVHWHGLLPPSGQDGVPDLPQPLLPGGQSYDYDFPLESPASHMMTTVDYLG